MKIPGLFDGFIKLKPLIKIIISHMKGVCSTSHDQKKCASFDEWKRVVVYQQKT